MTVQDDDATDCDSVGKWTNRSVLAFASGQDPPVAASAAARRVLEAAVAAGMQAPPVDPISLARMLGLALHPSNEIADAEIFMEPRPESLTTGSRQSPLVSLLPTNTPLTVAYNPSRPRGRLRFSIAHEIAHALFPDVHETVRRRTAAGAVPPNEAGVSAIRSQGVESSDEWELELLCNIIAAELLLPAEAVEGLLDIDTDIDFLMEARRRWDVSTEALLRRLVSASARPLMLIALSRIRDRLDAALRVDYTVVGARLRDGEAPSLTHGTLLGANAPFATCTAVGQTARGTFHVAERMHAAQAVGIPGYPGRLYPRVLGLIEPIEPGSSTSATSSTPLVHHLGDILDLGAGTDPVVLAHVVTDAARAWGRRGVAAALGRRFPQAAQAFRSWAVAAPENLQLGNVHVVEQRDGGRLVLVVSMVAQHGYGPGEVSRLRYNALHEALTRVADLAVKHSATVHVPRIGAGQAGGRWDLIEDDLVATVVGRGVPVVVHTMPARSVPRWSGQ